MKNIKEDINKKTFKPVYLLYGSEDYLKHLYRDKLKEALVGKDDSMNYSYYEGKAIDIPSVISIANTLPFFSEHRVIVLENSGFFKAANDFSEYMKEIPSTTTILFIESEIDKRNKLYKAVKSVGYISEMNGLDEKNLKLWIVSLLNKEKKKVTEKTLDYFISRVGTDMENIQSEVEKLVCFSMEREIITIKDIDTICTVQLENQIFQMIDAIAMKQQEKALSLYYNLLALKEKPMGILYLVTRHFNILLQIKNMKRVGISQSEMAAKVSVPPFAVKKYLGQVNNFTSETLQEAVSFATDIEERIKTGRLLEKIGVELLVVKFSMNQS